MKSARPIRVAHIATIDLTVRVMLRRQLLRLRDEGFEVTAVSAPGPNTAALEADGIRHVPWNNATRAWDLGADVRAFAELVRILRRERFDVVHTHNAKPGVMGRVAARVAGVPCVLNTVHGFDAAPDDRWSKRAAYMGLEWVAARCSDEELYQSHADLLRGRRLGMKSPASTVLLGNGVDLDRFDPSFDAADRLQALRAELGLPAACPIVGTIGRLVAEKGYRELFAAARRIQWEMPEVRYLVVGQPDPAKHDAISEAEMASLEDLFVFAGWREDVAELIALMDVFVLDSWREGVPRSAMEAAAMGKPLVLSDIPGCHELERGGAEVSFVPPRDAGALTEALLSLLRSPDLRLRLGSSARAAALRSFDERSIAARVSAATREVLARKGIVGAPMERGDADAQRERARD